MFTFHILGIDFNIVENVVSKHAYTKEEHFCTMRKEHRICDVSLLSLLAVITYWLLMIVCFALIPYEPVLLDVFVRSYSVQTLST